jgi:hypothetical protein
VSKYKPAIKRKKRVFIDLEYINNKDLEKSIKEIFLLISQGKEKHENVKLYKTVEILTYFKQWYVYPYRDINETTKGDKIIHTVKSSV